MKKLLHAAKVHLVVWFLVATPFAQVEFSGLATSPASKADPVKLTLEQIKTNQTDTLTLALTFHMGPSIHLYATDSLFFTIAITEHPGLGKSSIALPTSKLFTNFDRSEVPVFIDKQSIIIKQQIIGKPWSLSGTLRYQACDSLICFTPVTIQYTASSEGIFSATPQRSSRVSTTETTQKSDAITLLTSFTTVGQRGGYIRSAPFLQFLSAPATSTTTNSNSFDGKSIILIIFLIIIGGIALNLTPCVLPMIPITVAVLGAGTEAKSRRHGLLVGSIYGFAMACTYGALGLVVVLTGTQFGIINSSPVFNLLIAALFIVLSLAMFDILQIDFTRFRRSKAPSTSNQGRFITIFLMGIIASLLAGACVAPVVISVVLYAGKLYASGSLLGLALPFLLGVGMALPWPFAAAGLSFLPKPGKWMAVVKYVFGVVILLIALYYGYTGIKLLQNNVPNSKESTTHVATESSTLNWHHSLTDGLQEAEAANKPVFIDFWASWCKNCTAMDATTFRNEKVMQQFSQYVLIKFQAERPDDPATKRILDYFNIVGLPTYVILQPER